MVLDCSVLHTACQTSRKALQMGEVLDKVYLKLQRNIRSTVYELPRIEDQPGNTRSTQVDHMLIQLMRPYILQAWYYGMDSNPSEPASWGISNLRVSFIP